MDNKDKDPKEIINYLFFGNIVPTTEFFHLIVNCTHEIPFSYFCKERVRIPIEDDTNDALKFMHLLINTKALEKIHTCVLQHKNVLVHCFGDENQRSFAVICCYLIRYHKYSPIETIEYVHTKTKIDYIDHLHFMNAINMFYQYSRHNNYKKRLT